MKSKKLNTIKMAKTQKKPEETNVERFYKWLQMCGNIYLHDNEKIIRAFHIVANH